MSNILLIEDNEYIQEMNKYALVRQGYCVHTAMNLAEARESLKRNTHDLIVLDIMLPDGNGLDFLRELRDSGSDVPVLLLTALSETDDEAKGILDGGDDYIAKPYDNKVLLARISGLLRRARQIPKTVSRGTLTLKLNSSQAFVNGEYLGLSALDFKLLLLMAQNEGRILKQEYIYEEVWGQPLNDNKRAVENAVSRLRKGLESSGYDIITKRGQGYIFTASE